MEKALDPQMLLQLLGQLEVEIQQSIAEELFRIGRTVSFDELGSGFFKDDVDFFIETIAYEDQADDPIERVMIETSTSDIGRKSLAGFFIDGQIEPAKAILLLEQLKLIV